MKRILTALALALSAFSAVPVHAQAIAPASQPMGPQMFLLVVKIINSVGTYDTVTHFYAEATQDITERRGVPFVLYFQPPGTSVVRKFRGDFEEIAAAFSTVLWSARNEGKTWRAFSLIIDHGDVSVSFTEPEDLAPGDFTSRLAAANARIFSGLTAEPSNPAGN